MWSSPPIAGQSWNKILVSSYVLDLLRRSHFPAPSRSRPISLTTRKSIPWGMSATRRFVPVSQWEDARHLLGLEGEHIAMAYLISCGWSMEAHRFRLGRHEIDLVVRKANTVAFVEAKTRRSTIWGSGLEAVSRRKQRDLAGVSSVWVLRQGRLGDEYRFDLVSVHPGGGNGPVIEHVADAWRLLAP